MPTPFDNHCYGGKVQACPFYDRYFYFEDVPYWRSVGKQSDVQVRIDQFFDPLPEPSQHQTDCLDIVLQYLDRFIPDKIGPLSTEHAAACLPRDTSPGFPYTVTEPGVKKGELLSTIVSDYKKIVKPKKGFRFNEPCSAGLRLALAKKPANKPRLVWVYPAVVQLAEAKFFIPIYSLLYRCKMFAWDFSFLRGEYSEVERWLGGSATMYGSDVSSFDATVYASFLYRIFDWIASKFRMNVYQKLEFQAVADYFVNTPLWYKKQVYLKKRGVPSGSFYTQLIDSIVNLSYQIYIFENMYHVGIRKLDGRNSYPFPYTPPDFFHEIKFCRILGDDSLVGFKEFIFKAADYRHACECLRKNGVIIHAEKGFFRGEDCINRTEFLGFEMPSLCSNLQYPLLRKDPDLVVAQCMFPESQEKHPGIALARLIGIKWSCGDDNQAHEAVDYFHSLFEERHADAVPGDLPKEFKHLFQFVFGRIQVPVDKYPSTQEVVERYRLPFKSRTLDILRIQTCSNYIEWVDACWSPMSFAEVRMLAQEPS